MTNGALGTRIDVRRLSESRRTFIPWSAMGLARRRKKNFIIRQSSDIGDRPWTAHRGVRGASRRPRKICRSPVTRSTTPDSRGSFAKDSFNFLRFERNYPTCNAALRRQIAE